MGGFCFICDKTLEIGSTVTVERGIQKLKDASIDRSDGKIEKFSERDSIEVHVRCRREYTRRTSINAFKKKQKKAAFYSSLTEKNPSCFSFKELCLFCGEQAIDEKERKRPQGCRNIIRHVATIKFRETILRLVDKRHDSLAEIVKQRVLPATDLVAVEARYHWKCFLRFNTMRTGVKNCRPLDERIIDAMEKIFAYIENCDDCQFTMSELMGVLGDFKPDEKTIKRKLEDTYGDRIVFSGKEDGTSIISFRDTHYDILDEEWYENRKKNPDEERFRILSAAAAILRQDMRSQVCKIQSDDSPINITVDEVNDCIPKSLSFFMEEVTLKNTIGEREPPKNECIAITHAIMSSVRPRACLPPLQLGLTLPGELCFVDYLFDNVDSNVIMIDGA